MNLRKTFFILPNLFTLSSVFCGFLAITLAASVHGGAGSLDTLFQAAIAICFAFFFDLADGRVARLTKTQSELGLQLDSLADVISFGAAPALLVYKWGLTRFGLWGIVIGFVFCGAAALRLARFNVLAMRSHHAGDKPGKFILGLPVPVAASVLVSLVVLSHQLRLGDDAALIGQASLAVLVLVLSYLMVSRIRFRSFKDLRLSRRTITGGLGHPGAWSAYLVDLPGYGYARGGSASTIELAAIIDAYFAAGRRRVTENAARETPRRGAIFLLVDSRHPGLTSDIEAHRWIGMNAATPRVIATKVDKLSRAERTRNLREFARLFDQTPLAVSSTSGEGLDELRRLMANLSKVAPE